MAEPRIVATELCSPRGTTKKYTLQGTSTSPGGTKSIVKSDYKHQSVDLLRRLETVDRKRAKGICAKNSMSYNRAMAHYIPGKRDAQLEAGQTRKAMARAQRKEQARADLARVAAAVGL